MAAAGVFRTERIQRPVNSGAAEADVTVYRASEERLNSLSDWNEQGERHKKRQDAGCKYITMRTLWVCLRLKMTESSTRVEVDRLIGMADFKFS